MSAAPRLVNLCWSARKLLFESRCMQRDLDLYRNRLMGDLAFGVVPYQAVGCRWRWNATT